MKKTIKAATALCAVLLAVSLLSSCTEFIPSDNEPIETVTSESTGNDQISGGDQEQNNAVADEYFSNYDLTTSYNADTATFITLSGSSAAIEGTGASVSGGKVTIHSPGSYVFSGTLNGCITVNIDKTEKAHLIFNGVTINAKYSSAVYVESADKVSITLAQGTQNYLSDPETYTYTVGERTHDACIYSRDDLTINGSGKLTVMANYKNGITCKNDLRLVDVDLTVSAVNNALKADDSIAVRSGAYNIEAGNDGIKVSDDPVSERGFIYIAGGTFTIVATDDALQADVAVTITDGSVTTHAEGKAVNCDVQNIASGTLNKN